MARAHGRTAPSRPGRTSRPQRGASPQRGPTGLQRGAGPQRPLVAALPKGFKVEIEVVAYKPRAV